MLVNKAPQLTISVVVPVYNSELTLPELVRRLELVLTEAAGEFELLLVNDGSQDQSWPVIQRLASEHAWVFGIDLMRNYGQHNAILCGIRAARFEIVVTMDDDLQNPPEEIPKLLEKLAEGFDVVYGTPNVQQHGFLRNLASRLTKRALQGALGAANARDVSAFRAFRTAIREAFGHYHGPFISVDALLSWGTLRFSAQMVRHDTRDQGRSNYTVRKLMAYAIDMMTGFSTLPLRLASFVGFAATLFGIAVMAYVILRYIIAGGSVPGFPFLASIISIFSGSQLFALGIIGEYLARMHFRAMDRPTYAVRQDTKAEKGGLF